MEGFIDYPYLHASANFPYSTPLLHLRFRPANSELGLPKAMKGKFTNVRHDVVF